MIGSDTCRLALDVIGLNRCGQNDGACNQTHEKLDKDDYIVDAELFEETLLSFLNETIPTTSADVFSSSIKNYDVWEDQLRVRINEDY